METLKKHTQKHKLTHTLSNSTSRHRALTDVLVMGRCIDMYMFMVVLIMVLMLYAYRMPCEEEKTKGELLVQKLEHKTCM